MQIQLSVNDSIFSRSSIQGFKEITEKTINNIKIALTPRVIIIYSNEEKTKLIDKYHNDPVFSGHCGKKDGIINQDPNTIGNTCLKIL